MKKNEDGFRVKHPLEGLEPEEQEKEIEALEWELAEKMYNKFVGVYDSLKVKSSKEQLSPEERFDILKNALKTPPFGKLHALELKRKEAWRRSYIPLFLLSVLTGCYFVFGINLKSASKLGLGFLFGALGIWILFSIISLSKTYKLS